MCGYIIAITQLFTGDLRHYQKGKKMLLMLGRLRNVNLKISCPISELKIRYIE